MSEDLMKGFVFKVTVSDEYAVGKECVHIWHHDDRPRKEIDILEGRKTFWWTNDTRMWDLTREEAIRFGLTDSRLKEAENSVQIVVMRFV